jgi:hypothetical protein
MDALGVVALAFEPGGERLERGRVGTWRAARRHRAGSDATES